MICICIKTNCLNIDDEINDINEIENNVHIDS